MKIVLYGINYAPELTGIGKYSGELCEWLAQHGNEVRVVCAPPYYPEWKIGENHSNWRYRNETINGVTVFRCPLFIPSQPNTLTRLIHLASFALTSLPIIIKQWFWKPEVVICIEPTFFCVPGALLLSKLAGSLSILHIQDFELDAMLGLGMGKSGILAKCGKFVERTLMRGFNMVSSISYSMLRNAQSKIEDTDKLFYLPNWVDTQFLKPGCNAGIFRQHWSIPESTQVVLYSGNMGKKQGLEIVLQAAEQFRENPDILFLMVGAGAALAELKQLAERLNLDNLRFYPLQPYEDLPALLALADVHLVIQKKGAADAVLPSKLSSILAVGGDAVITAEPDTELGLLCEKYPGIAYRIEPEDASVLAKCLATILESKKGRSSKEYNTIAHQFALDNLQKDGILGRFASRLTEISFR